MQYSGGWSLTEAYNLPVGLRKWFVERLAKQLADEKHLTDKQGLILAGADRALREILLIFRDDPIEGPLQEASMGVWTKILQEES